ncbi:Cadmium, cobalt and zinc/H(+)-K(+) antiporter [compost metagenome]
MEGTPARVNQLQVKETLQSIEGVLDVHDLHIWTITSGLDSLSCHLLIEDQANGQLILQEALQRIDKKFNIQHTTIQIENSQIVHPELQV